MTHEFKLKPLSSGLGLGSLKASKSKPAPVLAPVHAPTTNSHAELMVKQVAKPLLNNPLEINPSLSGLEEQPRPHIQRQAAKSAYTPHSVNHQIKARPLAQGLGRLMRSLVGWGLDVFVVAMTLVVCLIAGTLAWRVGSGVEGGKDPFAAVADLINQAIFIGPLGVLAVYVAAFAVYGILMKLVLGSTIGGVLRR